MDHHCNGLSQPQAFFTQNGVLRAALLPSPASSDSVSAVCVLIILSQLAGGADALLQARKHFFSSSCVCSVCAVINY